MHMERLGKIDIVLDELLKSKHMSRNKFTRKADIQYHQTLRYCRNDMQKVDLNILCKMCKALDCDLSDILKYTPPEETE